MKPRRSVVTWTPSWKIHIQKGRKRPAPTGALYSVPSMATLHSILALQVCIFSNFHLLKCQILTYTLNRGFNGKSKEIPDSKIFPSSQTPAPLPPTWKNRSLSTLFGFPSSRLLPQALLPLEPAPLVQGTWTPSTEMSYCTAWFSMAWREPLLPVSLWLATF